MCYRNQQLPLPAVILTGSFSSYLRRALQSTWGMHVDKKPTLQEYFQKHGLPNADWVGWSEDTNMDDVKVKMVHQNNLDPGE